MNSFRAPSPWRLLSLAGLLPGVVLAQAGSVPSADPVIVTATRNPVVFSATGTAVDFLSATDLGRMQLWSWRDALAAAGGTAPVASGARGGVASLFLRGAESDQALFLVDGVRFSDSNTEYFVALGGADAAAGDQLEIVRGPQSTLYGADAVGGVVAFGSRRGAGPASSRVAVEAGSFRTVRATASTQAGDGAGAFSFSLSAGHTDNDRANNDFDHASFALRVDRRVNESVALGATWRGFLGHYGSPGPAVGWGANDPDNTERESNQLATVFADLTHRPGLASHVVLGAQARRYVAETPDPFGDTTTLVRNSRLVLDWQTTWTAGSGHRVTGGLTAERNATRNNGFGDIDQHQRLLAVFAQDEWEVAPGLNLTGGLRADDFDTFGRVTTGRLTAAWRPQGERLKLRASYGTGFRAPSFLDLYGQSAYYVGNPSLRPERARGWDAGCDWSWPEAHGMLGLTWHRTELDNLITFDFAAFPGTVRNVEQARTEGLEFTGRFEPAPGWQVRLTGGYLEARNLTQGTRLLRRPRLGGSVDLWHDFGGGFSAGGGCVFAHARLDVDAVTFSTIRAEDYTVARVYAAWRVNGEWTITARAENALDESYAEVNGYPQPGRAVYAGLERRF